MRIWALLLFLSLSLWAQKPALMLLETYRDHNVSGWLMSEKLDGVRAYWDGTALYSRNGNLFAAPPWFTEDFPPFALDGELWSGRGAFEEIASITAQLTPHEGWRKLAFHVFDVPDGQGGLAQRLSVLEDYLKRIPTPFVRVIPQYVCEDTSSLEDFLASVEGQGGEGVVVRDPNVGYLTSRSPLALKVKRYEDAECEVVAHHEGKGKFEGLLGAFTCKDAQGKYFRIGSGLKDTDRHTPPPLGATVTYKYYGTTNSGLPRFPVFLHVRSER